MITEEIAYYKANRTEFLGLYHGKHLVIKGQQITGVYDTNSQAYEQAIKMHEVGTFIIERPFNLKKK